MIDDAMINQVVEEISPRYLSHYSSEGENESLVFTPDELLKFVRAIEQLAKQEQREESAKLLLSTDLGNVRYVPDLREIIAQLIFAYAESIRAAGKENKID